MIGRPQSPLPDAAARRRAVTDFDHNLVVLAGAGTGKTSLLVERSLIAIGSAEVAIDRMAAITFTEKAAGEMRERLATGLDGLRARAREESAAPAPGESTRAFDYLTGELGLPATAIAERALAAMEGLDRATVTTIHGLCSELLRSHPVEGRVDPEFIVDSGEHLVSLWQTEWERFLSHELGPSAPRPELWRGLLDQIPLGTVGELARQLADFRVPQESLESSSAATEAVWRSLHREAESIVVRIDSMFGRQVGMADKAHGYFRAVAQGLKELISRGITAYRQHLDAHPQDAERIASSPGQKTKRLTGVSWDEVQAIHRDARRLTRKLPEVDDALAARVIEALAPFVREFRESFLARGLVSFDGLLALTRDLLRDHPSVRQRVKQRFRSLLVDEFQDTDPLQHEIVLLLAEDPDSTADDPYAARLGAGRLFVVGDAKQSIYRFRGADYWAYRRAVDRIVEQDGATLDLVGNFRSVPGLVEPVNRLFDERAGYWQPSEYQPSYVPIEALVPSDDGPAVELWTVDIDRSAGAEARRETEGRWIAREIERRIERRECRYHEITILFRAFTRIAEYLRPLRERGIPFVVDGGRDFIRRPEVAQLIAALRALSQPADEPALLAFMRSPAGGVPDTELAAFVEGGGRIVRDARPDATRFPQIARCLRLLETLTDETRDLPADAVIRRVIARTHQLELGAAAYEGAQRVANLRKLGAAAGELARDGRLSLEQVVEAIREGRLADIETDRPLSDDAAEAVRITSIHRMKGLENRWVILPDLARADVRPGNSGTGTSVVQIDGRPVLAWWTNGLRNAGAVLHELEHEHHEQAEEARVLYVAMTRARERMIAVVGPGRREPAWVRALAPWGYRFDDAPPDGTLLADGAVLHRRSGVIERPRLSAVRVPEPATRAVEAYRAATERWRDAARPPFSAPSHLSEEPAARIERLVDPACAPARDLGRSTGIVLHRLLERWSREQIAALTDGLSALCDEVAAEESVDRSALFDEAQPLVRTFVESELAARLQRLELLGREIPIVLAKGDTIFRGNVDLLYRDDDGQLVVADYKTDREDDPSALVRRYSNQLGVYADAVRQAMGLAAHPRTELWLLRSGRRVALDTGQESEGAHAD